MTAPTILEIPIPLCDKHRKEHNDKPFFVKTCHDWVYLAIPTALGSTQCRECHNCLFIPMPFLLRANLRSANLRSANLYSADLYSAIYDKYTRGLEELTEEQRSLMRRID